MVNNCVSCGKPFREGDYIQRISDIGESLKLVHEKCVQTLFDIEVPLIRKSIRKQIMLDKCRTT